MTNRHPLRPLPARSRFLVALRRSATIGLGVIAVSLAIGVLGYHYVERLAWLDALLEASMILSGMGPIHPPVTAVGKVFASGYAIFSGVVFVSVAALVLAPALHRVVHRLHLEEWQAAESREDRPS